LQRRPNQVDLEWAVPSYAVAFFCNTRYCLKGSAFGPRQTAKFLTLRSDLEATIMASKNVCTVFVQRAEQKRVLTVNLISLKNLRLRKSD